MLYTSAVEAAEWQQVLEAEFAHVDNLLPPDSAAWQPVELPDQWSANARWEAGLTGWYRIPLPDERPETAQAIYLQRISTNARVFLNQQYVGSGGSFDEPISRNMHRPLFFRLPESAWLPDSNYAYIQLRVYPNYAHLGALRIGSEAAMRPTFERQFFIQNTLSQIVFTISLLCGLIALLLWAVAERRPANLYFALTTLCWSIYCLNLFIRDIPIAAESWWALIHVNLEWACVWMLLFCHRLLDVKRPWLEWSVVGFAIVATIVYATVELVDINYVARRFHLGSLLIALYIACWLSYRFLRRNEGAAGIVAVCLIGIVLLGTNDLVRQTVPINSPDWQTPFYLLQFGAPAMFVILVSYLIWRYVSALRAEQSAIELLGTARQEERERIFQDLHDDLGAKLLSLVHRAPDSELRQLARQAMGDLRELVSGAGQTPESLGDVVLRLSLEAEDRCEEAGLNAKVTLGAMNEVSVSSEFTHHVARILRELLSNTIRHAGARHVVIQMQQKNNALELVYRDDGTGFGEDSSQGLGIPGIVRRAKRLDGVAEISATDGFQCRVLLPVDRYLDG